MEKLETWIAPSGTWTALTNQLPMTAPAGYSAGASMLMELTDGRILIQGSGATSQVTQGLITDKWFQLSPDTSGNYVAGQIFPAGSTGLPRLYFGSNVLPNGKVLMVGGENAGTTLAPAPLTNTGELFDPDTDTWTPIANFSQTKFGDDPTELLPSGQVLAGYILGPQTYLYTPASASTGDSWSATGTKLHADTEGNLSGDRSDEESWTLVPATDSRGASVLSYDVYASRPTTGNPSGTFLAQRYFPSSGTWTDASPTTSIPILSDDNVGNEMGAALRLPDGRIFEIGGNGNTAFYNPSQNTWTAGTLPAIGTTQLVAADAPAAMLPNGKVLLALSPKGSVVGLAYSFPLPTYLYEYDPATNAYTPETTSNTTGLGNSGGADDTGLAAVLASVNSSQTRMLVLPNGHLLFSAQDSTKLWDYNPSSPDTGTDTSSWPPVVSSITSTGGNSYTLTGTQLTGISEGAAYGDDAEMSTNFPTVIIADSLGNVWYAKTTGWTPGVADTTSNRQVQFTLPPDMPAGQFANRTFTVSVVASGIASAPVTFTPAGNGPMYANATWAGLSATTPVAQGEIGVNCWASVDDAVSHAPSGGSVVVFGYDGVNSGSGLFNEAVAINKPVTLFLTGGNVTFGSLAGSDPTANVILHGVNLATTGDAGNDPYDGLITGTGSLTKTGSGTWTLTGNDYVAGGTTVNGGVLYVTGSINGPGGVTANGGEIEPGSATALSRITVTVNALPGLVLNGLSATLGGLAGSAGISLGLTTNLILTVGGNNADTTYSGNFSGLGSLTKVGGGTLALSGPNSSVGTASLISGGLLLSGSLAASGGVIVNGIPNYDGSHTSVKLASGNALAASTLVVHAYKGLDGNGLSSITLGGLAGEALIVLPNTTLTVGNDNANTEFDGTLAGSGLSLTKVGTGTLTLAYSNIYTGSTTISAGTLEVDGSLGNGALTVASGATLQGTGTIGGSVVVSGALQAGTASTIGTLTINGNLTLYGALNVRINGLTSFDKVIVQNGNAALAATTNPTTPGPTLNVTIGGNYTPSNGDAFEIIDLVNTNNGTFSVSGGFGTANVGYDVSYAGGDSHKDVVLTFIVFGGPD